MDYSALATNDLLSVCASLGDAAAWEEFIRRFNPLITRVLFRVASRFGEASNALIDDLAQETYLKICANECKLLKTFKPHQPDSIFSFLKVVASNVAHDHFKSRRALKRGDCKADEALDASAASTNPENSLGSPSQIERAVLIRQIDQQLSAILPLSEVKRARMVFWLYYRAGLTASAIASLPAIDLTTKGVESLLFRLTRIVRENLASPVASGPSGTRKGFPQAESF